MRNTGVTDITLALTEPTAMYIIRNFFEGLYSEKIKILKNFKIKNKEK